MIFYILLDLFAIQYVYRNYTITANEVIVICLIIGFMSYLGLPWYFSSLLTLTPYMLYKIIKCDYK